MSENQTGRALKIKFKTSDPDKDLAELAFIMVNLRYHTSLWNMHYGGIHRTNKKRWEEKADLWLKDHSDPGSIPVVDEE